MQLLEREAPLQHLDQALSSVVGGNGVILFVTGEAGAGKTSLLNAFAAASASRADVHIGACDPLGTPRPLGPLLDMASGLGHDLESLIDTGANRHRILRSFLDSLCDGPSPKLVIIEDAHWADEATLDLLLFTARRIQSTPALMLVTYRDDEVTRDHPLQMVLGDVATSSAIHRLRLTALSENAIRSMTEGTGIDPVELHRRTNGNPFYVTEVLSSGASGVPATVRDAVLARAARLSRSARSVLDAAATIGAFVRDDVLREVAQADAGTIDECLASGVLQSYRDGYAFRHEIGREAILEAIPAFRRTALHRAILDALEHLGVTSDADGLAQLAHHAEEARDSTAVIEYAPAAARRAVALHAHREAAAQYARALRWADDLEPAARADLLELFATESHRNDRLDDTIRARMEALDIRRSARDRAGEGRNLVYLATALGGAGRNAEAHARSREAIGVLEAIPPTRELAHVYRGEAHLRMLNRDTADAVYWGGKAIELAQRFDDEEIVIAAEQSIGAALLVSGDQRGVEYLTRALERSRAIGNDELEALALGNLGSGLGEIYSFEQAVYWLRESIKFAQERDHDRHHWYSKSWLALAQMYIGDWSSASTVALEVIRRPYVSTISLIMALAALGRVRTRQGAPDVWDVLDRALDWAIETDTLQRLAPVRAARAEAAWFAGDWDRAIDEAAAAFELAIKQGHAWFAGELAYWQWKSGASIDVPDWAAEPFRLQIIGDWTAAAQQWKSLNCPYEAARALAESEDPNALRDALAQFHDLGALPMIATVQRRMRSLGIRGIPRGPRPATRENPAGLTRRECEVLPLVAEGLTNVEIAERLYLSPRTVENHVSSILMKLDARTRVEAVRAAQRLDVLPPN